jgi:hypothetical protein
MYVVLVYHKLRSAMLDLMASMVKQFPNEKFSIYGSEAAGYQFRINGMGDERQPRKYAEVFLKKWKPSND